MSGTDRRPQTSQPVAVVPFDVDALARGEALAIVTLPDGRLVIGTLYASEMVVPTGPPAPVSPMVAAQRARRHQRTQCALLVGGWTALGWSDNEIVAELIRLGLLKEGEADDDDRGSTVKVPTMVAAARSSHTATLLPDGRVLVAGMGMDFAGPVALAEIFDPKTGTFSLTGPMVTARDGGHTATPLLDGDVLVVGGGTRSEILASAEIYDPKTRTFSSTGP